ncbi:hypothetical protein [Aeromonas simiae]|uniref:hypothetical protein n=1 Tax=Aeromonas simiae TaxID=218936 RepID=UPI0012EE541C|nr:hypothetical protein [Aeromonas simiae]
MPLKDFDFGNEAGDDATQKELASYFVEQNGFKNQLNCNKRVLITTARKGVGKSALIKRIFGVITEEQPDSIVISCRGSDLTRDAFKLSSPLSTPNDYIRDWMIRIPDYP